MKLEKRRLLIEIEKRTVDTRTGHISFQFRIGPFKKTMATTIGSALRRTLLSMTKTLAITSVCGNFKDGNSIREDLFELSLNLQRIHIKSSFFPYIGTGRIHKKGPAIITAKDLVLEEGLEVVNPYQYICTINKSYTLDLCVMINSPGTNQGSDYIDPLNPINFAPKNLLKEREYHFSSFSTENTNNFRLRQDVDKTSEQHHGNLSHPNQSDALVLKSSKNIKTDKPLNTLKDSKINIGVPQKLPIDIVIVDPIYSALQSCGFEIVQTTNSSVTEYEELIKRGVSETEEFLRFIVVSRGAIEPSIAIQTAIDELKDTLSILEPLSHVFSTERNLLLSLEKKSEVNTISQNRQTIVNSYTLEILKSLDIRHLRLPNQLELFLRREGFITLNNIVSVPLEFLKRIGLNKQDITIIEEGLNRFNLSLNIKKNLSWELIPSSLPFK
uniref:RNA polymerase subunit alpha n=1 Tax=Characiopsis acuta TaxID=2040456 RepID=A0A451FLJ9_9STRA|nr:RNA polymerase subunit alpha [Characiopsis acuta]QAA11244.1 RNA polymerase subunit alpha [Characiopsis acuta]